MLMSVKEQLLRLAMGAEPISDLVKNAEEAKKERERRRPEVLEAYPLLNDEGFVDSHRGIIEVVSYLHFNLCRGGLYGSRHFQDLFGADSLQDWLLLLQEGNEGVIRKYKSFREAYA